MQIRKSPIFAADGGGKIEVALRVTVRVCLLFGALACPLPPPWTVAGISGEAAPIHLQGVSTTYLDFVYSCST
jgi:hypothetical protein